MPKGRRIFWVIVACVVLAGWTTGCDKEVQQQQKKESVKSAFKAKPRNIGLVLDTSGSMEGADKKFLTLFSAILFADLAERDDMVSLVTFPSKEKIKEAEDLAMKIGDWADDPAADAITAQPRDVTKAWIKQRKYDSNFTIFTEPIQKALNFVTAGGKDAYRQRAIVVFSDGGTDRQNPGRSNPNRKAILEQDHQQETMRLKADILPQLQRKGVEFYGVVLGQNTASDHLVMLAGNSEKAVQSVSSPEELTDAFAQIFSQILQTDVTSEAIPASGSLSFTARNYLKELLLIAPTDSLAQARKLGLKATDPNGSVIEVSAGGGDRATPKGVTRQVDGLSNPKNSAEDVGGYVIWRLKKPEAGNWQFTVTSDGEKPEKLLIIENVGIYLEVEGSDDRHGMVGEKNTFVARLVTEDGEEVTSPEFFNSNDFSYLFFVDDELKAEIKPSQAETRMRFDYQPEKSGAGMITIRAKNSKWLDQRVNVHFEAHDEIKLSLKGASIDFKTRVPWTDWFLEGLGALVGSGIWTPGDNWEAEQGTANSCVIANFSVPPNYPKIEGVRFKIDNTELYSNYKARLINPEGEEEFRLDEYMRATFCLDMDRDSDGGSLAAISVPISTANGKEITGLTALPLQGTITPLSAWTWKYSHVWLEELLILWLLLYFVGKPVVYAFGNSFPKGKRYYYGSVNAFERKLENQSARRAAKLSMGRSLPLRLILGYFQFLWGTQLADGGARFRRNVLVRAVVFIFAAVLPLSMADKKLIGSYSFYRFKGSTRLSEAQAMEIIAAEDWGGGYYDEDRKPNMMRLVVKEHVDQALVKDDKILHIP